MWRCCSWKIISCMILGWLAMMHSVTVCGTLAHVVWVFSLFFSIAISLPPPLSFLSLSLALFPLLLYPSQHFILVISAVLAYLVPDVPQHVKNEIQREKLLAYEAIHARQEQGKDLGIEPEDDDQADLLPWGPGEEGEGVTISLLLNFDCHY